MILVSSIHSFCIMHLSARAIILPSQAFCGQVSKDHMMSQKILCQEECFLHLTLLPFVSIQLIERHLSQISCFQDCEIQACLFKLQDYCLHSGFVLNTCAQLIELILLMQATLSSRVWLHFDTDFNSKLLTITVTGNWYSSKIFWAV